MATRHSSQQDKTPAKTAKKAGAAKSSTPVEDDAAIVLPARKHRSLTRKLAYTGIALVALFAITTVSLRAAYSGRIYPGVWGHGTYLGGLSPQAATSLLNTDTASYAQSPVLIQTGEKTVSIKTAELGVTYNNAALSKSLLVLGRQGNLAQQVVDQWSLLLGLSGRDNTDLSFNPDALTTQALTLNADVARPSVNAHYKESDGSISFADGQTGTRLDFGALNLAVYDHLASLDDAAIVVPLDHIAPAVDNATLADNKDLAQSYVSKPLVLTYNDKTWPIAPTTALGWLHSTRAPQAQVYAQDLLAHAYPPLQSSGALDFDTSTIDSYLVTMSKDIDQDPVNAVLGVDNNKAVIAVASKNGQKLDVVKTRTAMLASLTTSDAGRDIAMTVTTTRPEINEDNLASLGIQDLLSEGVTIFPGSPPNRLINVRTGAARFNGVILKPDQVFSFGELLGPVGAEQGYVPGLIILEDHEEMAYGGGLCQVSSTAYRAALLAGLPILQRTNHAFAISYYTAPYGVPGVDATIYYPPVDLKFRNDTGAYIYIQTEMVGSTLKFRYYGTKKKEGVIRGPFFVSGNSDVNKPSHTVFYRDIIVNGQVTKTDEVNTYYKSALDYPVSD